MSLSFRTINKIKNSPEWNWYQERLNLIDMGMMRGHISYIVMECLSGKYPEQLQYWEEQLEQNRMRTLYGEQYLETHFEFIDEKVKNHPYFAPHNPNTKEEN